ncbi:MAG: NAD-binding protein [Oscillospiraceae bacterium]|nr:NAD-binding protein [Oscillospiraceae bacterium]
MKTRVFLIGGFDKTKSLAISLLKKGYLVTAINKDMDDCKALAGIEKLTVFTGDGSRPFILEDANVYNADIAIALTDRDDDNLVICELCKKKFNVKRTVALVSDPKKMDFFYRMGIDSVVCAISVVSGIIEQHAFMKEMETLLPVGDGRIKIVQIPIYESAPAVDKKLSELSLPKNVIVGCILRGDKNIVPHGNTRILSGDVLVLISTGERQTAAIRELTGR